MSETFVFGDPVILIDDQPVRPGSIPHVDRMPKGCIGYVVGTASDGALAAINFGLGFGTVWCDAAKLRRANPEYVARAWRKAMGS